MEFEDRLRLPTPEGVTLEVVLAGAGSRALAAVADAMIQAATLIAVTIAAIQGPGIGLDSALAAAAIAAVLSFALFFFYYVGFETLWSGRTPGKKLLGLRVVTVEGRPPTFRTSMIRNLIRIVDFLPFAYGVAIVSIIATRHNQRLGDLAAGTLVVRDPRPARPRWDAAARVSHEPADATAAWDVTAVSAEDAALVRRFLDRRDGIRPEARARIARDLDRRLRPKVGGVAGELEPERFLERLAAAKAARS